jgi:hypothetical protein
MNLFARALGGLWPDRLNMKMGMRGRLWIQTIILLVLEGIMIVVFCLCTQPRGGSHHHVHLFHLYSSRGRGHFRCCSVCNSPVHRCRCRLCRFRWQCWFCSLWTRFPKFAISTRLFINGLHRIASATPSVLIRMPCHAGLIAGEDNHVVIQSRHRYQEQRLREHLAASLHSRRQQQPERDEANANTVSNTHDANPSARRDESQASISIISENANCIVSISENASS